MYESGHARGLLGSPQWQEVRQRAEELAAKNDELAEVERRRRALQAQNGAGREALPSEQDVAEALRSVDPVWDALNPAEQERLVRLLVGEVVVNPDGLVVRLRTGGIASLVTELEGVSA